MTRATIELDKVWTSEAGQTYGTIQIRVVVLSKADSGAAKLEEPDSESEDDELLDFDDDSPLASYLEKKHGRLCAVFVVNGQRHDAWDNTFLVRDLGLKYLKTRTMLIVNLDGLAPEALAELMQGSRQGFFKGKVYHAIRDRIIATLKGDPDLKRLQIEAEEDIASLESGDSAVKNALDQLIDDHHSAATRAATGAAESGTKDKDAANALGADKKQTVVIEGDQSVGTPGELPTLTKTVPTKTIRLHPDTERVLAFRAQPATIWTDLKDLKLEVEPEVPDLVVKLKRGESDASLSLCFYEPEDFEPDEYPVITTLRVIALFAGHTEPRMIEYTVVVNKKKEPPEPKPLLPEPTFLRVTSRKPVKLYLNGPSAHVKLRWDGQDSLAVGDPPAWAFIAQCLDLTSFPIVGFSKPKQGRFELLLDTPSSLLPGAELEFEVTADGPNGKRLTAMFPAIIAAIEPTKKDEPRRIEAEAPATTGQRRPPYDLKYVTKDKWNHANCWGDHEWTQNDVGCFVEPTDTNPLTLLINTDAEMLRAYQDHIVKEKKLDPNTVQRRITRYNAHLAFHLFQMYEYLNRRRKESDDAPDEEEVHIPTDSEMRDEANRVAATLIRLMEVSA
jgi:hypothetical protein